MVVCQCSADDRTKFERRKRENSEGGHKTAVTVERADCDQELAAMSSLMRFASYVVLGSAEKLFSFSFCTIVNKIVDYSTCFYYYCKSNIALLTEVLYFRILF